MTKNSRGIFRILITGERGSGKGLAAISLSENLSCPITNFEGIRRYFDYRLEDKSKDMIYIQETHSNSSREDDLDQAKNLGCGQLITTNKIDY